MDKNLNICCATLENLYDDSVFCRTTFSIFDHCLSQEEAKNKLMCYEQAVNEGRLCEFAKYEESYKNAFLSVFDCFKCNKYVRFIYENGRKKSFQWRKNCIVKKFDEDKTGYIGVYKPKRHEFEKIVEENLKEILPFKHVILSPHQIYIIFSFDLTFDVIFKAGADITELKKIFLSNGFYEI